jgi:hypothetical protein
LAGSKEFLEVEGMPLNAQNVGAPTFKLILEGFPVLKFVRIPLPRRIFFGFLPQLLHANIAMLPDLWYSI